MDLGVERGRLIKSSLEELKCVKNPPANAGDQGSIPGSGKSSEEGKGYLL